MNGNQSTIQYKQQELYAKFDCSFGDDAFDDDYFITQFYEDDQCSTDPTVTRNIPKLSCEDWLYENETNFGFDIKALVKSFILYVLSC